MAPRTRWNAIDEKGAISRDQEDRPCTSCTLSHGKPCKECMDLEALDVHFAQLTVSLDTMTLSHERSRLQSAVNCRHDPITARVPVELAAHIFRFNLPEYGDGHVHPSTSDDTLPVQFILGAVCRAWRKAVWTSPELWTSLTCDILSGRDAKQHLIRDWLERSGQLPLSIHLYTDGLDYYQPSANHKSNGSALALINILNVHSPRWRVLCVSLPPKLVARLTNDNIHWTTSVLDNFRLRFIPESARAIELKFLARHSPVCVDIGSMALPYIDFDWTRLARIKAEAFSASECMKLFQHAPLLQEFELSSLACEVKGRIFSKPPKPIAHLQLRAFRVMFTSPVQDSGPDLLDSMAFPALQEFEYHFTGHKVPVAQLISLFLRSQCRLQIIALHEPSFSEHQQLRQILTATPSLQQVQLSLVGSESNLVQALFDELSRTADAPDFLPHLRTLRLDTTSDLFPWSCAVDIFGSGPYARARPLRHLKLGVHTDNGPGDKIMGANVVRRVFDLHQQGVELEIRYKSSRHHGLNVEPDMVRASMRAHGFLLAYLYQRKRQVMPLFRRQPCTVRRWVHMYDVGR